ncbi:MAG: hypothetical protein WDN28_10185 [Chthoniobacter sp.]
MNLAELLQGSGLVPPESVQAVLKKLSDDSYRWMVCAPDEVQPRLQGDILDNIPAAAIFADGSAKRRVGKAMVINTACDLQPLRSEFINVAVVQDFTPFAQIVMSKDERKAENLLRSVKKNEKDEFIYIPHCAEFPDAAIVRLDMISTISPSIYDVALGKGDRRATLTMYGYYYLQMKLTRYFARPEPAEVSRETLE